MEMTNPFYCLALGLFLINLSPLIFGGKLKSDILPNVRIIEIQSSAVPDVTKDQELDHLINKPPNSNIIIGEDVQATSKLVFECDAQYPVQWVYNGDGMPEYSSNTSSNSHTRPGTDIGPETRPRPVFIASISLGFNRPIGIQDSGKFTCHSLQNPSQSVFYNLYVKDNRLFQNPGGVDIYYRRTDESVKIPCSVSNPNATVSLQKSVNGLVTCPLNESIKYEPSIGFNLKISSYFDPTGVYVCTAGFNDSFQVVRYTLIPSEEPQQIQQKQTCQKHDDCPGDQACIKESGAYVCTSPCAHVCGRSTRCETVNNVPRCYCLPGFKGDPYSACFPLPPTQRPENIEKDPCDPNPCGLNTRCQRYGKSAQCSCQPGYQGDPYVQCYHQKNICTPNPCGPNSECAYRNGYASCTCSEGFFGAAPYCRAECEVNHHCNFDRSCIRGRCRNPCDGACLHLPGTQCRVIRRMAVCDRVQLRCPYGYYGRDCQSIYPKNTPNRIGSSETGSLQEESITPCNPSPCGSNAECSVENFENKVLNATTELGYCQCKAGYTGSSDIECYPLEELARNGSEILPGNDILESNNFTDTNKTLSLNNSTISTISYDCATSEDCEVDNAACIDGKCLEAKKCGINAISILSNQVPACSCPEGYTGFPLIECHKKSTTEDLVGINGTDSSVNVCSNQSPCGKNTNCIFNSSGVAACECKNLFEGNPWIGCELNCTKNEDCPSTQLCHEQSKQCINPCDSDYQPFLTECGRNSGCKVKDHVPYCFCPDSFPHGSPNVHCKEEKWMPNHLKFNSSCENSKKLKCGPNTSCKRFHDEHEYCVCLPGFFGDPYGDSGCKLGIQCRRNLHCKSTEDECVNGKCMPVCRKRDVCGENQNKGCIGLNHKANCICHIGTILNPKGECEPMIGTGALAERMYFRSFEDI